MKRGPTNPNANVDDREIQQESEQSVTSDQVLETVLRLVPEAPGAFGAGFARLRSGESHDEEGHDRDRERENVDGEDGTDPRKRESESSENRPPKLPERLGHLNESGCSPEVLLRHEYGHCRRVGRPLECLEHAGDCHGDCDVPQSEGAGQVEQHQNNRPRPGAGVGEDHRLSPVPPVDEGPSEGCDQDLR